MRGIMLGLAVATLLLVLGIQSSGSQVVRVVGQTGGRFAASPGFQPYDPLKVVSNEPRESSQDLYQDVIFDENWNPNVDNTGLAPKTPDNSVDDRKESGRSYVVKAKYKVKDLPLTGDIVYGTLKKGLDNIAPKSYLNQNQNAKSLNGAIEPRNRGADFTKNLVSYPSNNVGNVNGAQLDSYAAVHQPQTQSRKPLTYGIQSPKQGEFKLPEHPPENIYSASNSRGVVAFRQPQLLPIDVQFRNSNGFLSLASGSVNKPTISAYFHEPRVSDEKDSNGQTVSSATKQASAKKEDKIASQSPNNLDKTSSKGDDKIVKNIIFIEAPDYVYNQPPPVKKQKTIIYVLPPKVNHSYDVSPKSTISEVSESRNPEPIVYFLPPGNKFQRRLGNPVANSQLAQSAIESSTQRSRISTQLKSPTKNQQLTSHSELRPVRNEKHVAKFETLKREAQNSGLDVTTTTSRRKNLLLHQRRPILPLPSAKTIAKPDLQTPVNEFLSNDESKVRSFVLDRHVRRFEWNLRPGESASIRNGRSNVKNTIAPTPATTKASQKTQSQNNVQTLAPRNFKNKPEFQNSRTFGNVNKSVPKLLKKVHVAKPLSNGSYHVVVESRLIPQSSKSQKESQQSSLTGVPENFQNFRTQESTRSDGSFILHLRPPSTSALSYFGPNAQAIEPRLRNLPHYVEISKNNSSSTNPRLPLDPNSQSKSHGKERRLTRSEPELSGSHLRPIQFTLSDAITNPFDADVHYPLETGERKASDFEFFPAVLKNQYYHGAEQKEP